MKIDLIDRIGTVLYWTGLADLAAATIIAISTPHPRSLNYSAMYWTLIACGLVAFVVGGLTHMSGWGLNSSGSGNHSSKSPRAPRG